MLQGGFFSRSEVGAGTALERLTGCGACGLYKECESPKMEPQGRGEKGILIISPTPNAAEDRRGKLGVGKEKEFLRKKLADFGIDLEKDCREIAAACCRPPKGRTPTGNEIAQCRPRIRKEIESFKPILILLLGSVAVESFLGDRWTESLEGIDKWRGWQIPDRETGAWVCPLLDPSNVLKSQDRNERGQNPVLGVIFDQDLHSAMVSLETPFPDYKDEREQVEIISDQRQLCNIFNNLLDWYHPFALDFETTGLKPHARGHAIVTASISIDDTSAWVWEVEKMGGKAKNLFKQILAAPHVPKRAHNVKFEDNWASVILDTEPQGWQWDSMIAAHLLDNRPGITGLKFQSYVQFGLLPYDEDIKYYLRSSDEDKKLYGGNAFNTIRQAPRRDLMIYNGLDTILEFRLAELQMKRFR